MADEPYFRIHDRNKTVPDQPHEAMKRAEK